MEVKDIPLSLLKCYAQQSFEVLMKNSVEVEVNEDQSILVQGKSLNGWNMPDKDASRLRSDLYKSVNTVHKGVTVASRFFIDCIGHLPAEFRTFASDVLLSGLRSVIKDASSAILAECKQIEQRLMLHDVGLSLGIVEWIDDYHAFCSSMAANSFVSSGALCLRAFSSEFSRGSPYMQDAVNKSPSSKGEMLVSFEVDKQNENNDGVSVALNNKEISDDYLSGECW